MALSGNRATRRSSARSVAVNVRSAGLTDTILFIDSALSAIRFAGGDDSNHFLGVLDVIGMSHQENGRSFHQADGLPTEFIFHHPVLADENAGIIEDLGCDLEPDAVLAEVGLGL